VTEGVARAALPFFLNPSRHFTAVNVSVGTAGVDGVRNSVEFIEKNIRTYLDAVQEMVEMKLSANPYHRHRRRGHQ
jgi:hypothetical protein